MFSVNAQTGRRMTLKRYFQVVHSRSQQLKNWKARLPRGLGTLAYSLKDGTIIVSGW